ncbi:hypothetical protein [Paraflavitalea speifideaquila]|uniref:hypothetical protein n=1 Tax=Paraflavitalea speifideaquila TaxID=3076558 RepID=UPI0028E78116|nr:hypothetical protein [Paraflavitalea speifideiaquila]
MGPCPGPAFDSIAAYPVKTKVNSFQVKDITGDGVPDLTLIYTAIDDWFGILQGKTSGSFGQEQLRPKPPLITAMILPTSIKMVIPTS